MRWLRPCLAGLQSHLPRARRTPHESTLIAAYAGFMEQLTVICALTFVLATAAALIQRNHPGTDYTTEE